MTGVLAFAAFLLLPLIGSVVWTLGPVRRMDPGSRLAIAGATGMLITGALLGSLSILGISWSRTVIVPILAAIAAGGLWSARRTAAPERRRPARDAVAITGMLLFLVLTVYGLLSARETCGDLHFFWGPRAVAFHHDGGVTVGYLTDRNIANAGYPPLLPLVYSWSLTLSRQFSWPAAVLATALFLAGAVALVRGAANRDEGGLLMAATLSYAVAMAFAAGAAEGPLLLFETLTLVALVWVDEVRTQRILTAIGLLGAAMLKIEGAVFAVAVIVAVIVVRRSIRTILAAALPAAAALGAWLWFVRSHSIEEHYRGATMPVYLDTIPETMALIAGSARYDLLWLPWLVPAVLIALGRTRRAALLPLIVALLTLGAMVFYYIHMPDPTWWILNSAPRVLLTPLTALLIAATAANGLPNRQTDGV